MSDLVTVHLTKDYETNGQVTTAGNHSLPKEVAEDLMRRETEYQKYREGITEKHEYMGKPGSISMGDGGS